MEKLYEHRPSRTLIIRQFEEYERHERERKETYCDEKINFANHTHQPKNKINIIDKIPVMSSKDQAHIVKSTTSTLLRDSEKMLYPNCTPDSDAKKWKQPNDECRGKRIENKKVSKSGTKRWCINCGLPDVTTDCLTKAQEPKCFQCNELGHIVSQCKKQRSIHTNTHSVEISADRNQEWNKRFFNSIVKGENPFDTYLIDYVGPLPPAKKHYQYIFVIIDTFSKYVWLYAMQTVNVKDVLNQLIKHSSIFGNPRRIISNVGKVNFASNDFAKYCKMENIEHMLITIGISEVCEQAEHLNHILIPLLTKLTSPELKKWHKYLLLTQQYINTTLNRSIGTSPFYLLFGREARLQDDPEVRELLEKEYNKAYQDKCDLESEQAKNITKIQHENKSNLLWEQAKENVKIQRESKSDLFKEQAKENIKMQCENKNSLLREQTKGNIAKIQNENKSDLLREQAKKNVKLQRENISDLFREQAKKKVKIQRENKSDLYREQAKENVKLQHESKNDLFRGQAKENVKIQRENKSDLFREQAKENVKIQRENKSDLFREQAEENVKLQCESKSDLFREQAKENVKIQRENKNSLLREQAKGNIAKIQDENKSNLLREQAKTNVKIQREYKSDLFKEQAKENVKLQRESKSDLLREQGKEKIAKIQGESKNELLREQAKKNVKLQRENKSNLLREQAKENIKIQRENKNSLSREQAKGNIAKIQDENKSDLLRKQGKGNIAKIQGENKSDLLVEQATKIAKLQRKSDLLREQAKKIAKLQRENKSDLLKEQAKGNIIKIQDKSKSNLSKEQAKENIVKIQNKNKNDFDKNGVTTKYQDGDLVAIERTRYAPDLEITNKYLGPYQVTRVLRYDRYIVKRKGGPGKLNFTSAAAKFMKPWARNLFESEEETDED